MKKIDEASKMELIVVNQDVIETSSIPELGGWDDSGDPL